MNKVIWLKTFGVFLCCNVLFLLLGLTYKNEPGDKFDQTLHEVAKAIKQNHFSPKEYDDSLSAMIYADFLKRMDDDKSIFLQSDILAFNKYKYMIDDELNGEPVLFFYEVLSTYKSRIAELHAESHTWLQHPISFNDQSKEVYYPENPDFPKNNTDRTQYWLYKIKYMVLENLVALKENREQSKVDSIKQKTDMILEAEARASVEKVINKIFDQYSKNTDEELFSNYVNSFVNMMDPHSDYFLPVAKRSWDERLSGKFYGIGAQIGEQNGYLRIAAVSVGGPAWRSGEIEEGDLILKVGQGDEKPVDIAGFSIPEGVQLIRGGNKTIVSLTMKKTDGTVKIVKLVREELRIEETFARSNILNYKDKKYGVINLPKFYTNFGDDSGRKCADDVAKELEKLKAHEVDGVIMDLRNNGGGSLQEVVDMVGLFIPAGPVVQVKGKNGRPGVYFDRDPGVVYDGPLTVMVNEFSASASEIFAAAIQDYRRGMIIGSGTYGKGTVQRPYALSRPNSDIDLGNVHITMQKYYRINGSSVQLKGVVPDIRLNGYYESYKVKEKDQESALPWDGLAGLQYTSWPQIADVPALQDYFKSQIDTANAFATFDENGKWLAANGDQPKVISESAYRDQLKSIREKSAFNRNLMRLTDDLDVYGIFDSPATSDSTSANGVDKIKIDRNNRITNFYKRDRYLQITADLMNKWLVSKPAVTSANN